MDAALARFFLPGLSLTLTLLFGFWLSSAGKPYPGALFNVHKLLALGAVVLFSYQFSSLLPDNPSLALTAAFFVLAALCVLALFLSGALLSLEKLNYTLMFNIHRIAPFILVISIFLLLSWLAQGSFLFHFNR